MLCNVALVIVRGFPILDIVILDTDRSRRRGNARNMRVTLASYNIDSAFRWLPSLSDPSDPAELLSASIQFLDSFEFSNLLPISAVEQCLV